MTRDDLIREATLAAQTAKAAGAPISVPITVAQAALESNFGQSQLSREAFNYFGIKIGSSWGGMVLELPTQEWSETRQAFYTTIAKWRKYEDAAHGFEDYGALINRLYPNAANNADDARAYLDGLFNGQFQFATDPNYREKVWSIVEQYNLLDLVPSDRLLLVYDATGAEV